MIQNFLVVGVITVVIKGISFYKETLVSAEFGLSELLDTFFIAALIPSFIQNVFLVALKNLFIPNYIIEQKSPEGRIGAFQAFTLLTIVGISLVLTLCVYLFSIYGLEHLFPGHTERYYSLIRGQLYILLPCITIWAVGNYFSGLLDIANKFFVSSISALFAPVMTIIFLFTLVDELGSYVLSLGLLCGSSSALLLNLFCSLYFKLVKFAKIRFNDNMRMMLKQYPPKIISAFLTGVNPFVDQFFAAQLIVGSIAAINYGVRIPNILVGILMIVLGKILLPFFSRQIGNNKEAAFQNLKFILKLVFGLSLFISSIFMIFSEEIIRFVFERGEFDPNDTELVSSLQIIALLYSPFVLCTLICVQFLTAFNKNKFMAWASLWNLVLNLILNYLFVKIYGVYGLVLSTTIVCIINSFLYVTYTLRLRTSD
ncbi:murein biosynthesis integral membrane protein MurJ [Robiginitalea biformata]